MSESSENVRNCPNGENRSDDNALTDKQLAAVELLAIGHSVGKIATTLQVDPRTLYRWRQEPDFQEALAERRGALWSDATARVRGMLDAALSVIEQQLGGSL